ncbi:MAG: hypothetical protein HY829_05090 [Actinobacteria bacterium]|nr:hypothetical protein [Actinomycetota bacterium]
MYTVFHTEHKKKHVDDEGDLNIYGKNIQRLIGVYSSRQAALAAVDRMRLLPGFHDEPDCFCVDEETVDQAGWDAGFTRE